MSLAAVEICHDKRPSGKTPPLKIIEFNYILMVKYVSSSINLELSSDTDDSHLNAWQLISWPNYKIQGFVRPDFNKTY